MHFTERKISQTEEDSDADETTALNVTAPAAIPSITIKAIKNFEEIPEDSPLASERAAYEDDSDGSFEEKKVQFNNGKKQQPSGQSEAEDRKRRRSRHQYYRQRKYSHQDSQEEGGRERKISVQPEDSTLEVSFFVFISSKTESLINSTFTLKHVSIRTN